MKFMFIKWAIDRHSATNHFYDTYLPYEFHLRLVAKVANQFKHLWPKFSWQLETVMSESWNKMVIEGACYGHDLIEDVRATFNDIVVEAERELPRIAALYIAEIIRAVTSDVRGRNRKERMSPAVYKDIREVPGATLVKL